MNARVTVLLVIAGCRANDLPRGRYACDPAADRAVGSTQCPGDSRCGLEGFCHDVGDTSVRWRCENADDCEGGWLCGVGDDGVRRECHDPAAGAAYRCTTTAECSGGWTCGLDEARLRRCHDPLVPRAWPCEASADCVASWQCGLSAEGGRECHDPQRPAAWPCLSTQDCLGGWQCGLSFAGTRECHDPANPEAWPCVSSSDCVGGFVCLPGARGGRVCRDPSRPAATPCETSSDCVGGWQCGLNDFGTARQCHDPTMPRAFTCATSSDCVGGWQCGLNDLRTGRECHDPSMPRAFACVRSADCVASWVCGLSTNRPLRECHDPSTPRDFTCDVDDDCVGGWRCNLAGHCADARPEELTSTSALDAGPELINPLNITPIAHVAVNPSFIRRDLPWVVLSRSGRLEALRVDDLNARIDRYDLGVASEGALAIQSPFTVEPNQFATRFDLTPGVRVYAAKTDGGLQVHSLSDGGFTSQPIRTYDQQIVTMPITKLRQGVSDGFELANLLGFSDSTDRWLLFDGARRSYDFSFPPAMRRANNRILDMADYLVDGGPDCVLALDEGGVWARQFLPDNNWDFEQVSNPLFKNSTCSGAPGPLKVTSFAAATGDRLAVTAIPTDGGRAYVALWNLRPMLYRSASLNASFCTSINGTPCAAGDTIPYDVELGPCQPCIAGQLAQVTPVATATGVELDARCVSDAGVDRFVRVARSPFSAGQCETRGVAGLNGLFRETGLSNPDQPSPGRFVSHSQRGQLWLGSDVQSATSFSFDRAATGVALRGPTSHDVLVVAPGLLGVPTPGYGLLSIASSSVLTVASNEPQWVLIDTSLQSLDALAGLGSSYSIGGLPPTALAEPRTVTRARARDGATLAIVTSVGQLSAADVGAALQGTQGAPFLLPRVSVPSSFTSVSFPNQTSADAGVWLEGWAVTSTPSLTRIVADSPTRWRLEQVPLPAQATPKRVLHSQTRARLVLENGVVHGLPSRVALSTGLPSAISSVTEVCGQLVAVNADGLFRLEAADAGLASWRSVPLPGGFAVEGTADATLHTIGNEVYLFSQGGDAVRLAVPCP